MGQDNKIFNGKLNLDVQPYRLEQGDWIDALNITRDSEGSGQDIVVSNLPGNTFKPYNLPLGTNKVIGQYPDKVRNRVYYFMWNSNNWDMIFYYDVTNDTIVKVLLNLDDTGGEDILNFNPSKRINHVDIIYRDDDGDLMFWTDGNSSPKKINVPRIVNGDYGTVKKAFIEIAKAPPLDPPTCVYGSDASRNSNSLKKTMFQFSHRWRYDDYEKSTFSTYSKIPLPIGFYGSDNNIDNTKNNFITITVQTGDKDVTDIEIAMRYNIGNAWSDFVLVTSINKAQYGISDNITYDFLFYNDELYPPIDILESTQLFDYVPQLADCQALGNGNIPIYAAITEGYNNYPVNELDVTLTAENKTNIPPDTDPPSITYYQSGSTFLFTVSGSVPTGTNYHCIFRFSPTSGGVLFDYTSIAGDTINSVAAACYAYIQAHWPGYANILASNTFSIIAGGGSVITLQVTPGSSGGSSISTEKTWLWDANYVFGIVYVDEKNRDIPGVTSYVNPVATDNDFLVTTPSLSEDSGSLQTPVISASINHLPPADAVAYYWVRRRMTYGDFLMYETCDFQDPSDGYYYFCLANIDQYYADNNQFIYGSAPITTQSRIKVMAGITAGSYDGNIWDQDYEIVGTVTRTLTGGTSPDDDKTFIKVVKPTSAPSPSYQENMLVMIYTPLANPTSEAESVYYEWGEKYDIYELDGVRYHRGMDQDQTGSQPATFTWEEGDVYFHTRGMYRRLVGTIPYPQDTLSIMDASFSDFFQSAVNDNGRAQAIEVNAQQLFNPTLCRFGGAYQNGTSVNNTNRFYSDDFDEYDRSNGIIRKLFIEGRKMFVFQQFDVGVVPILTQVVRDVSGNPLEANSETLLNKIVYPYIGKYGIGDIPESFTYGKNAKYFCDSNKGVVCRLSLDGITPISVVYECNAFFVPKLKKYNNSLNNGYAASGQTYTGNPTVYSQFNEFTNRVVFALEEINRYDSEGNLIYHQEPYTITFNEARNQAEGFESFCSFHPEMMTSLNNLFMSFKNGFLWTHNNPIYCNYYDFQYGSYIQSVFNQNSFEKKTYTNITEYANTIWPCTSITTELNSYGSVPQSSYLIEQDFRELEGNYHANFYRDINSSGGIINGNPLKGNYIIIKFEKSQTPNFVYLNIVKVNYIDSPLTTR